MARRWKRPNYVRNPDPGATKRGAAPQGNVSRRQGAFERARVAERRRRRFRIAGITAGVLVGIVALTILVTYIQVRAGLRSGLAADPRIQEVLDPVGSLGREPFYMLILGSDQREGDEVGRPDTIILARIDVPAKTVSMLSIPRDTRVEIPGHGTGKINAAGALGGTSLMIETVRDLTGLPVNHYLQLDFFGFKDMVDALGGVWVDVPMRIDDRRAASEFPEARVIEAGRQKLDGKHALTFVRARYDLPRQDLDRIANQQLFLRAVIDETLSERNPLRIKALADASARSMDTDLDIGKLALVGRSLAGSLDNLDMAVVPGEPRMVGGVSYVIADEPALAEMVGRMRQGQPMIPSEDDGQPVAVNPVSVSVTVHNGAGVSGVASAASVRLEAHGFNIAEVGNANQYVYDETLVVYKTGGEDAANLVAGTLGKGRPVPARGMYAFNTDILVVVGKDWADR